MFPIRSFEKVTGIVPTVAAGGLVFDSSPYYFARTVSVDLALIAVDRAVLARQTGRSNFSFLFIIIFFLSNSKL